MNPFEVAKNKKWLNDKKVSRDITRKILEFGVSQNQIRNIIFLLALELESSEDMKAITAILRDEADNEERKNILIPGETNE